MGYSLPNDCSFCVHFLPCCTALGRVRGSWRSSECFFHHRPLWWAGIVSHLLDGPLSYLLRLGGEFQRTLIGPWCSQKLSCGTTNATANKQRKRKIQSFLPTVLIECRNFGTVYFYCPRDGSFEECVQLNPFKEVRHAVEQASHTEWCQRQKLSKSTRQSAVRESIVRRDSVWNLKIPPTPACPMNDSIRQCNSQFLSLQSSFRIWHVSTEFKNSGKIFANASSVNLQHRALTHLWHNFSHLLLGSPSIAGRPQNFPEHTTPPNSAPKGAS